VISQRQRLQLAASQIAANYDKPVSSPIKAFSKLFIAPHWTAPGVRAVGLRRWKRGEMIEVLTAGSPTERRDELGDCGYYIAQTWAWLWRLYETVTPSHIVRSAVAKFERRAKEE
jgi:hypothetical protein